MNELAERIDVRGQSGDDWHDGAFNSLDDIHRRLVNEGHSLNQALTRLVIDYPDRSEPRITLGSLALISQNEESREVYLVGYGPVYDRKQKPSPVSVDSPLGKSLIGAEIGQKIKIASLPKLMRDVSVLSIDQTYRPTV